VKNANFSVSFFLLIVSVRTGADSMKTVGRLQVKNSKYTSSVRGDTAFGITTFGTTTQLSKIIFALPNLTCDKCFYRHSISRYASCHRTFRL